MFRSPNFDLKELKTYSGDIGRKMEKRNFMHPLHLCVRNGDCAGLQIALNSEGIDVDCADSKGFTPLMLAIKTRNLKAVHMLLKSGAKVSQSIMPKIEELSDIDCVYTLLSHWIIQSSTNHNPNQYNAIQSYIENSDFKQYLIGHLLLNKLEYIINSSYYDEKLILLARSSVLHESSTKESMVLDIRSKVLNMLNGIRDQKNTAVAIPM